MLKHGVEIFNSLRVGHRNAATVLTCFIVAFPHRFGSFCKNPTNTLERQLPSTRRAFGQWQIITLHSIDT